MRFISLIIAFMLCTNIFAQEVLIGTYQDSNSGSHNVVVRLKDDSRKIDCVYVSVSSTIGGGYYRIDGKNLSEFAEALRIVKAKFEEWTAQAHDNNITTFTKQISVNFPKVTIYLSGKANFNFSQKPNALFQVENGNPCLWIYASTSTNLTKYNNKKVVFSMLFDNPTDMDGLLALLKDEATILQLSHERLQDETKLDDLFQ